MDAELLAKIISIAKSVVEGGVSSNPKTVEVEGLSVTINSLNTSTQKGCSIQWTIGKIDYTVEIKGNGPFGKIVPF